MQPYAAALRENGLAPDGKQLGFNSVHEGSRQVYVIDVK